MTRTVDLVVVGADPAAIAATVDAARRGMQVLVVIRSRHPSPARDLRQSLRAAGVRSQRQVTIITGAEVACADGVNAIEAVVVRQLETGRLIGFNASALLAFGECARKPRPTCRER